jgi:dTDP-4-dehydrorhamnose 3,5-epimerase
MRVTPTAIAEVLVIEPKVFADARGFFFESYNERAFAQATGVAAKFVQDNHSRSVKNTVRGLHYQIGQAQGKLVRAVTGEIYDVVVDVRRKSPTFGKWVGHHLSAENKNMLWIPPGFAHGFAVLSDYADFLYKTTDYWAPQHERTLLWNDPDLGINWPLAGEPILADKDRAGKRLAEAEVFE